MSLTDSQYKEFLTVQLEMQLDKVAILEGDIRAKTSEIKHLNADIDGMWYANQDLWKRKCVLELELEITRRERDDAEAQS